MTFPDGSIDAVICLAVPEHVANSFKAASEIRRVLRENCKLLLAAPFLARYQGKGTASQNHDSYPDYWRFTHEGLQKFFDDYKEINIFLLDGPIEFRLKQFYCGRLLQKSIIRKIVDLIDRARVGKATTRHLLFGVK
jgi:SAM-dependent methyltransferase